MLYQLIGVNVGLGHKELFTNLSLTIEKGDKIGILGLNGCGKSTLFKILNGDLQADQSSGPQYFHSNNSLSNQRPFLIPQEIFIPSDKIYNVGNYFSYIYPGKEHLHPMFESYLKSLEFTRWEQDLRLLSGGEQKKILLALGLICENECLLWDEPTNHLDFDTIVEFEKLLMNTRKTFLIITHDRVLLTKVATKLFILHNKKLEEFSGNYPQYLEHLEQQTIATTNRINKLSNHLRREDEWMKQGIKARGTRSKKRVENFESLHDKIGDLQNSLRKKWEMNINQTKRLSRKLLEFKNLEIGYDKVLFKTKILTVFQGEKIGIIGKSGMGKSSFLDVIMKKNQPLAGSIDYLDGINIQIFSQKRDDLPFEKSPYDYIGEGSDVVLMSNGSYKHVITYLDEFGFNRDVIHREIKTFSGGEKNRLQLAKHLTYSADLYIFDEPTNDLDLESIELLEKTLMNFAGAVLIVGHDRSFIENICNKFFVIQNKEMIHLNCIAEDLWPYLELNILQNELDNSQPIQNENTIQENQPSKPKYSNAQKNLIKNLGPNIDKTEKDIEKLQTLITCFDHAKGNSLEYAKLCKDLNDKEEKLLELYELKDSITNT